MPFGGVKASGVAREGGLHSLDFYSEESTICMKLGQRKPPPMPGRAAQPPQPRIELTADPPALAQRTPATAAASASATSTAAAAAAAAAAIATASAARPPAGLARNGSRAFSTTSASASGEDEGFVTSAPKPMGAYAHVREAGGLLYLAGIGPRDPATDCVPGGPVEAPDGRLNDYDVSAQTRQCITNVRTVLESQGLGLHSVVDVHAFLIDIKRDFAAFNAEYAAAFGQLPEPPVRTTVEVGQLPPGGRIAVELKVTARAPPA